MVGNTSFLFLTGNFKGALADECFVVVSMGKNGETLCYKTQDLHRLLKPSTDWQPAEMVFQLPQAKSDSTELAFYIWNKGKQQLLFDNLKFGLY
jgi:archaellum component FlaG (FlaF/FlaG flagellin family)